MQWEFVVFEGELVPVYGVELEGGIVFWEGQGRGVVVGGCEPLFFKCGWGGGYVVEYWEVLCRVLCDCDFAVLLLSRCRAVVAD